jgi:hypothetical protein
MRAEKPDTAKYASFFDLDDILSHISNMYEDSPWHDLSHGSKGLGKLRSMAIVNLKISGLYRSDDLLHFCSGSLPLDKQASSGSRWGPLEAEGPRGKYPSFVIVHLSSTKMGPREDKLEAYPEEPALCPVYALWCYTRRVSDLESIDFRKERSPMPAFGRRVKLAMTLLETMHEAELQEEYHLRKEALLRKMEADRVVALAVEVSGGPTRKPQSMMWGGSSENARTRRRRTRAAERASVQGTC